MGAAACTGVGSLSSRSGEKCGEKGVIVISGPSGCGKSTLLNKLFAAHPDRYKTVVLEECIAFLVCSKVQLVESMLLCRACIVITTIG